MPIDNGDNSNPNVNGKSEEIQNEKPVRRPRYKHAQAAEKQEVEY